MSALSPQKTIELPDGNKLLVYADPDPESPRQWDNLALFICFHSRYNLGDEHQFKTTDYNSRDELEAAIRAEHDPVVMLPLYLYDHSGITISLGQFSCPWDSGQVGWAIVPRAKYLAEYGKDTRKNLATAEKVLRGEVKTYDQFLTGEVYGYELTDADGNHIDSCWGFFGHDLDENGILENIDAKYHQAIRDAW